MKDRNRPHMPFFTSLLRKQTDRASQSRIKQPFIGSVIRPSHLEIQALSPPECFASIPKQGRAKCVQPFYYLSKPSQTSQVLGFILPLNVLPSSVLLCVRVSSGCANPQL